MRRQAEVYGARIDSGRQTIVGINKFKPDDEMKI